MTVPPMLSRVFLFFFLITCIRGDFPSFDGSGNAKNDTGKAGDTFLRIFPAEYQDRISIPRQGPSARNISNAIFSRGPFAYNRVSVSSMAAAWGHLVAHDMSKAVTSPSGVDDFPIPVPQCDDRIDPECEGGHTMPFQRYTYDPSTGTSVDRPRLQLNTQTAFLDASVIYGTSTERMKLLRLFTDGKLIYDPESGLPSNPAGYPQAGPIPAVSQRLAGDVRANVNPGILALHGLFVLEHNRLCDELKAKNPTWLDEDLFQQARVRVMALLQHITVDEYIPAIIGEPLDAYAGYDPSSDPRTDLLFTTASLRYGHSGINTVYLRLVQDGTPLQAGHLLLRNCFFNPAYLKYGGILPILRGLVAEPEQEIDTSMVEDLRQFLFFDKLDLAAIDIQRGRDVGLPSYISARRSFGLTVPETFEDITDDRNLQTLLEAVYGSVDNVDAWVGGLAEKHSENAMVGPLFAASLKEQISRTRAADRFWYENYLSSDVVAEIKGTTLSQLIARNFPGATFPDGAFRTKAPSWSASGSSSSGSGSGSGSGSTNTTSGVSATLDGNLSIKWNLPSGDTIQVTLTLKGTGWLGMGFGSSMIGADIILLRYKDGKGEVYDCHSSAYAIPSVDSSQDVTLVSASESSGQFEATFSRKLNTGDSNDAVLAKSNGKQACIFAYSTSSDTFGYHAGNRLKANIDFFSTTAGGAVSIEDSSSGGISVYMIHGFLMASCWGLVVPSGIFAVRYLRHYNFWLSYHKTAMTLAASTTVPAAAAALSVSGATVGEQLHSILGILIAVFVVSEFLVGTLLKHLLFSSSTNKYFYLIKWFHRLHGYGTCAIAFGNIVLGIQLLKPAYSLIMILWVSVVISVFVLAEVYVRYKRNKISPYQIESPTRVAQLTPDEVEKAIRLGNKYTFFGDKVIDVGKYMQEHPGGAFLLHRCIGQDISQYFYGASSIEKNIPKHRHSLQAHKILMGLCVGELASTRRSGRRPSGTAEYLSSEWSLVEKEDLNSSAVRVCRLKFRRPGSDPLPNSDDVTAFGQHFEVTAKVGKENVVRYYSSVLSMDAGRDSNEVNLYVRRYPDGKMSKYLVDLAPGEQIGIRGPLGMGLRLSPGFIGKFIGIAQGTGIFPFVDFIRYMCDPECPSDQIYFTLAACFASLDDILFYDWLKSCQSERPKQFKLHLFLKQADPCWLKESERHKTGHVTSADIDQYCDRDSHAVQYLYICGSPTFAYSMQRAASAAGFVPNQVVSL